MNPCILETSDSIRNLIEFIHFEIDDSLSDVSQDVSSRYKLMFDILERHQKSLLEAENSVICPVK